MNDKMEGENECEFQKNGDKQKIMGKMKVNA